MIWDNPEVTKVDRRSSWNTFQQMLIIISSSEGDRKIG